MNKYFKRSLKACIKQQRLPELKGQNPRGQVPHGGAGHSRLLFPFNPLADSRRRALGANREQPPGFAALPRLRKQSLKFMASYQPGMQGNILREKKTTENDPKHSEHSNAVKHISTFILFKLR